MSAAPKSGGLGVAQLEDSCWLDLVGISRCDFMDTRANPVKIWHSHSTQSRHLNIGVLPIIQLSSRMMIPRLIDEWCIKRTIGTLFLGAIDHQFYHYQALRLIRSLGTLAMFIFQLFSTTIDHGSFNQCLSARTNSHPKFQSRWNFHVPVVSPLWCEFHGCWLVMTQRLIG